MRSSNHSNQAYCANAINNQHNYHKPKHKDIEFDVPMFRQALSVLSDIIPGNNINNCT
jgi:hypothetical protein